MKKETKQQNSTDTQIGYDTALESVAREGKPDSDTEANDNKHDVIKSVCPECGSKGVRPYRDHLCCYDCGNYFRKTVK